MNDALNLGHNAASQAGVALQRDPAVWGALMSAIRRVAQQQAQFTTDDVLVEMGARGVVLPEPRALGAAMLTARREGICDTTAEFHHSTRRRCHGRPKRVWRSCVRAVPFAGLG